MKRIGKYEILGLLGKGGMSVVYKARLPVVGKLVALKLLAPHPHLLGLWGDERTREHFVREARAVAALRHPNVVEVLDFDHAGGRPFFTMEYYYQNLGMILGEGAVMEAPCRLLSLGKILHYTHQLLDGLAKLHRAGILHRDIKPFNLLVTEDDCLKICDFGLSRLRGESHGHSSGGVIIGSPYYAAPEQEQNPDNADLRADLYSVGVVVCRMLTGLFPGREGLQRIVERPDAGEAWRSFVARATHPRAAMRPPSAQHMLKDLESLQGEWNSRQHLQCQEIRSGPPRAASGGQVTLYRADPLKIDPLEAPAIFGCDLLLRPLDLVRNDFEILEEGKVVRDGSTRLLWELSEWPDPLDWEEALAHVADLNREAFAGLRSWRLPTVPEMLSLSRDPVQPPVVCDADPFNPKRRWFWTSDRKSFCAAWYVDTELGYTGWSDRTCRYFARGVATTPGS